MQKPPWQVALLNQSLRWEAIGGRRLLNAQKLGQKIGWEKIGISDQLANPELQRCTFEKVLREGIFPDHHKSILDYLKESCCIYAGNC